MVCAYWAVRTTSLCLLSGTYYFFVLTERYVLLLCAYWAVSTTSLCLLSGTYYFFVLTERYVLLLCVYWAVRTTSLCLLSGTYYFFVLTGRYVLLLFHLLLISFLKFNVISYPCILQSVIWIIKKCCFFTWKKKYMKVFWKIISKANITKILNFWTPFYLNSFEPQFRQTLASCNEACTHLARYPPPIYSVLSLLLNLMKQNSCITGFWNSWALGSHGDDHLWSHFHENDLLTIYFRVTATIPISHFCLL
jgi:hypothetical protein